MTGTGTQADPYIVYTWDEFVSVADKAVYITCPDNLVWDMSEILPDGLVRDVTITVKEFDGNGLIIKNLYANGGKLDFYIGGNHQYIKRVSFLEISTSSEHKDALFSQAYQRRKYFYSWFQNCKFTGVISSGALIGMGGTEYPPTFKDDGDKSCSFDIYLKGDAVFCRSNTPRFNNCFIKFGGYTTTIHNLRKSQK